MNDAHGPDGGRVAIKVLHGTQDSPGELARMAAEASAAQRVASFRPGGDDGVSRIVVGSGGRTFAAGNEYGQVRQNGPSTSHPASTTVTSAPH